MENNDITQDYINQVKRDEPEIYKSCVGKLIGKYMPGVVRESPEGVKVVPGVFLMSFAREGCTRLDCVDPKNLEYNVKIFNEGLKKQFSEMLKKEMLEREMLRKKLGFSSNEELKSYSRDLELDKMLEGL